MRALRASPGFTTLAVVTLAVPAVSATGAPIGLPPSVNVTVPPGSLPATVAVNVTGCPTTEGLTDDDTLVVVCDFRRLTVVVSVPLLFEELESAVELETVTVAVSGPSF